MKKHNRRSVRVVVMGLLMAVVMLCSVISVSALTITPGMVESLMDFVQDTDKTTITREDLQEYAQYFIDEQQMDPEMMEVFSEERVQRLEEALRENGLANGTDVTDIEYWYLIELLEADFEADKGAEATDNEIIERTLEVFEYLEDLDDLTNYIKSLTKQADPTETKYTLKWCLDGEIVDALTQTGVVANSLIHYPVLPEPAGEHIVWESHGALLHPDKLDTYGDEQTLVIYGNTVCIMEDIKDAFEKTPVISDVFQVVGDHHTNEVFLLVSADKDDFKTALEDLNAALDGKGSDYVKAQLRSFASRLAVAFYNTRVEHFAVNDKEFLTVPSYDMTDLLNMLNDIAAGHVDDYFHVDAIKEMIREFDAASMTEPDREVAADGSHRLIFATFKLTLHDDDSNDTEEWNVKVGLSGTEKQIDAAEELVNKGNLLVDRVNEMVDVSKVDGGVAIHITLDHEMMDLLVKSIDRVDSDLLVSEGILYRTEDGLYLVDANLTIGRFKSILKAVDVDALVRKAVGAAADKTGIALKDTLTAKIVEDVEKVLDRVLASIPAEHDDKKLDDFYTGFEKPDDSNPEVIIIDGYSKFNFGCVTVNADEAVQNIVNDLKSRFGDYSLTVFNVTFRSDKILEKIAASMLAEYHDRVVDGDSLDVAVTMDWVQYYRYTVVVNGETFGTYFTKGGDMGMTLAGLMQVLDFGPERDVPVTCEINGATFTDLANTYLPEEEAVLNFSYKTNYDIIVDANGDYGTITWEGTDEDANRLAAEEGALVGMTVTCPDGYRVASIVVTDANGEILATDVYGDKAYVTFTMPAGDVTVSIAYEIRVSFEYISFTEGDKHHDALDLNAVTELWLTPGAAVSVPEGILPADGKMIWGLGTAYTFAGWLDVDPSTVTDLRETTNFKAEYKTDVLYIVEFRHIDILGRVLQEAVIVQQLPGEYIDFPKAGNLYNVRLADGTYASFEFLGWVEVLADGTTVPVEAPERLRVDRDMVFEATYSEIPTPVSNLTIDLTLTFKGMEEFHTIVLSDVEAGILVDVRAAVEKYLTEQGLDLAYCVIDYGEYEEGFEMPAEDTTIYITGEILPKYFNLTIDLTMNVDGMEEFHSFIIENLEAGTLVDVRAAVEKYLAEQGLDANLFPIDYGEYAEGFTMPAQDTTISIAGEKGYAHVQWVADGEVLYEITVPFGTVPTYAGKIPVKKGSDILRDAFSGWDKEVVAVYGDETYTALFGKDLLEGIDWVTYDTSADDKRVTLTFNEGTDKNYLPINAIFAVLAQEGYQLNVVHNSLAEGVLVDVTFTAEDMAAMLGAVGGADATWNVSYVDEWVNFDVMVGDEKRDVTLSANNKHVITIPVSPKYDKGYSYLVTYWDDVEFTCDSIVSNGNGTVTLTFTAPHYSGLTWNEIVYENSVNANVTNGTIEWIENIKIETMTALAGDMVSFKIIANEHYEIKSITLVDANGNEIALTETDGVYSFEMPAAAVTLTAICDKIIYENKVNVNIEHGTIEWIENINTETMTALSGSIVSFKVVADEHYELKSIVLVDADGNEIALTEADGVYSFEMPITSVTLTVVCEKIVYENKVNVNIEHGTIEWIENINTETMTALSGSIVSFKVNVDENYELKSIVLVDANGNEIVLTEVDGTYSFEMPITSVTMTVTCDEVETETEPETETETEPVVIETEPETEDGSDEGCRSNLWWIILLIILLLILIAIVIFLLLGRKKDDEEEEPEEEETEEAFVPVAEDDDLTNLTHVDSVTVEEADELMTDAQATKALEVMDVPEARTGKMGIVNIDALHDAFEANDVVDLDALKAKDLVPDNVDRVKVLASGLLDKPLTVQADAFSIQAIKMIVLTGGHAVKLGSGKMNVSESGHAVKANEATADDAE